MIEQALFGSHQIVRGGTACVIRIKRFAREGIEKEKFRNPVGFFGSLEFGFQEKGLFKIDGITQRFAEELGQRVNRDPALDFIDLVQERKLIAKLDGRKSGDQNEEGEDQEERDSKEKGCFGRAHFFLKNNVLTSNELDVSTRRRLSLNSNLK